MQPLTNAQIIKTAACHFCCAAKGQPCTWHRAGDPEGKKRVAKESHVCRIELAQKIVAEWLDA